MKILAVETSTMLGGIGLVDDSSGLFFEVRLNVKSTHSERLMPEIDHIMKQSGIELSDIDVFAISIGPGSFTGLRIGLSTVKGFSFATGKPIVAVPTLEALAWNLPYCRYPVCAMLDARKKEVYAALFSWEGKGFVRVIDETSLNVDRLLERIKGAKGVGDFSDERIVFIGEGALLYKDGIVEALKERAIFPSSEKSVPSPATIAAMGIRKALKGEFSEPVSLVPFYIRRSEAEIKSNKADIDRG
jgi:tRNA threonylcarbamoyladenosine biosynthesis protein TsaB